MPLITMGSGEAYDASKVCVDPGHPGYVSFMFVNKPLNVWALLA